MYLVYLLPLFLIVLVALAIFAGPVLAVLLFVLFLIGLGAYKFLGRGTDPEHPPAADSPVPGAEATGGKETEGGMWGETWPEQPPGEKSP